MGKTTILFIDDEEFRMRDHAEYLKLKDFDVIYESEFEKGIEEFKNNKENIDLLILDLMIPIMDMKLSSEEEKVVDEQGAGLVIYDRIRKIKKVKTIVLTIRNDMSNYIDGRGVEGYVVKPISPKKLLEEIVEVMQK